MYRTVDKPTETARFHFRCKTRDLDLRSFRSPLALLYTLRSKSGVRPVDVLRISTHNV